MEPTRPVHKPCIEIDDENNIMWGADREDAYSSNSGDLTTISLSAILQVVCNATCLAAVFLFIVPECFHSSGKVDEEVFLPGLGSRKIQK